MAYVMLVGRPPFWGGPVNQMKKMRAEEYPMNSAEWLQSSSNYKAFVRQLLRSDPEKRMTIFDALSHPFLMSGDEHRLDKTCIAPVLSNMLRASHRSRLFDVVMSSAARQINESHSELMGKVFNELDSNNDGFLDLKEVQTAFKETLGISPELEELQHMFYKLDLDGTGKLTYTEFCLAGVSEEVYMKQEMLWCAFKAFDDDDNGRISESEIKSRFDRENVAHELMQVHDKDSDGDLDFEEFKSMLEICAKPTRSHHPPIGSRITHMPTKNGQADSIDLSQCGTDNDSCQSCECQPDTEIKKHRSWARRLAKGMVSRLKTTAGLHPTRKTSSPVMRF